METKSNPIDIAAKELWQQICAFQDVIVDNFNNIEYSSEFLCEVLKKSSEFARYIDKNFYNDSNPFPCATRL